MAQKDISGHGGSRGTGGTDGWSDKELSELMSLRLISIKFETSSVELRGEFAALYEKPRLEPGALRLTFAEG
jgi:hypothetical protein